MRFFILILILSLSFSSCATKQTTAKPKLTKYETKLLSWMDHDINDLINSWGPPSDVYTMPNGNKMYTWLYVSNTKVTSRYSENLNRVVSSSSQHWCKTTFTADNSGKLIYWRWNGNACR